MLTCQQVTELVTDYLDGRLSFGERMGFQMHLGLCGHCRAYLRQMKTTVRALGALPADPIPAPMRDELLARFRRMRPRESAAPVRWAEKALAAVEAALGARRGRWVAGLVLAASVLLILLLGDHAGPLGHGRDCLLTELFAGAVPLALLVALAWRAPGCLSPWSFAAAASLGAFAGYGALLATCPLALGAPHGLVFHVGGILLAGGMGAAASQMLAVRCAR